MLRAGRMGIRAAGGARDPPDGSANNVAYFWLTGALSSFLDNAPTYLVFFELAGGDAQALMTKGALTLAAISCGAVFMGANSYIGNAPNFMVYAIARSGGVKMPSFFGYMLLVRLGVDPGVHPDDAGVLPLTPGQSVAVRRIRSRNNRPAAPLMATRGAAPFLLFPDLAAAEAEQRQAGGPARISPSPEA